MSPGVLESRNPEPAYKAAPGSPLFVHREFYTAVAKTSSGNLRRLTKTITVAPRSGEAWVVPAGSICRISTPEGPQVGDLNIWNRQNPREQMWTARSRQLHSSHLHTFDRLWSKLPYMRPMVTIIQNTLDNLGPNQTGGRVHDLLGTRCDPYINKMLTGDDFDFHCHSNLTRAILPYGLHEDDVHDNVNLFQVTGLNQNDQYFIDPCPAVAGDYIEFFAEMDVLCALSACPGGDESIFGWGEKAMQQMATNCRSLQVDVYEIEDQELLSRWERPKERIYTGCHGLGVLPEKSNGVTKK